MRIEWMTPCQRVDEEWPTTTIVAANTSGVLVQAKDFPTMIPARVAACFLGTPEEAANGGVAPLRILVIDSASNTVGQAIEQWTYEDGEGLHPQLPRRTIAELQIDFRADDEGIYWIMAALSDQEEPLVVPFIVIKVPDLEL